MTDPARDEDITGASDDILDEPEDDEDDETDESDESDESDETDESDESDESPHDHGEEHFTGPPHSDEAPPKAVHRIARMNLNTIDLGPGGFVWFSA